MCCEPCGSREEMVKECPDCGQPVDEDGNTSEACGYSPVDCHTCGLAPCDGSC